MDFDEKALLYAEKHGIVDYKVNANIMTYSETFPLEDSAYKVRVNLITMKETRKQLAQTA